MTNKEFVAIYQSIVEVQKGATRQIGNALINSMPVDLEIEISKTLTKLKPTYKAITETIEKTARGYGLKKTPGGGWRVPADVENGDEIAKKYWEEIEKLYELEVTDMNGALPIPLFTITRIKESGIEFSSCPLRQEFFENCVSPV